MIKLEDLKIKITTGIWGNAAYNHYTGEILVPPWWKPIPFYLVSIAHEVGHMFHHREIGTEVYKALALRKAELEAWRRGYETAKEWGITEEYEDRWRREIDPFGLIASGLKPQDPKLGPPLPKVARKFW